MKTLEDADRKERLRQLETKIQDNRWDYQIFITHYTNIVYRYLPNKPSALLLHNFSQRAARK